MAISTIRRRAYRSTLKTSKCRRVKGMTKCKKFRGCKYASGTKRKFCRRSKNRKY